MVVQVILLPNKESCPAYTKFRSKQEKCILDLNTCTSFTVLPPRTCEITHGDWLKGNVVP